MKEFQSFQSLSFFRAVSAFWRQVSHTYIKELGEDWAYGLDMKVFNYSTEEYLIKVGLKEYLEEFREHFFSN